MIFDAKWWLDAAQWVLGAALALFVWMRKPGEDAGADVRKLRDDLGQVVNDLRLSHASAIGDHAERLAKLETHLHHMPDDEEFRELQARVAELSAGVRNLTESLVPIRSSLARIEEYLLKSRG